ncbi:type VII secretion protein EsaA [Companilactobacillus sp. DQM5]|uniref:type VII secretion protein EsaA n=1 Tax=Companilactobacillus sp. DQM5 TaxID=3463359 RepID=UPI00405A3725
MKNSKKIIGTLIAVLLLGFILIYGILTNKNVHKISENKQSTIRYVLVNEDTGAKFHNQNITLGKNFVNLINRDNKNVWQVAPYNVAEAGFKNGSYDVEIILPQNFSQRLLNLESMDPQKAQITYKVKEGTNEKTNKAIEEKVGLILNSFNQKIIKMYFSSVLGNLSEAQRNVNGIVNGEQTSQDFLTLNIQQPFSNLPNGFKDVISSTSELKDENSSWSDQQNEFSKSTQNLLKSTGSDLLKNSSDLNKYVNLQNIISKINQSNASDVVKNQSESDTSIYKGYYDSYEEVKKANFNKLENSENDEKSGLLVDMQKDGENFRDMQQKINSSLGDYTSKLEDIKTNLAVLRDQTNIIYFNGKGTNASDDDVKTAISNLVDKNTDDNSNSILDKKYIQDISDDIHNSAIPDNLDIIIDNLLENGKITTEEADQYKAEFNIVSYYTNIDLNKSSKKNNTKITRKDDTYTDNKLTTTLSIDTSKDTIISLKSDDDNVVINDLNNVLDQINSQIKETGAKAIQNDDVIKIVPNQDETKTNKVSVTFNSNLRWNFNDEEMKEAYRSNYISWSVSTNNEKMLQSDSYLSFYTEDDNLEIQTVLDEMDKLSRISQKIITLYGSFSDGSMDAISFDKKLPNQSQNISIGQLAKSDSLFREKISANDISSMILNQYRENGQQIFDQVNNQYNDVLNTYTSVKVLSLVMSGTPNKLLEQKDKVQNWYDTANSELDRQYKTWKDNPKLDINYKQYNENEQNQSNSIYFDDESGKELSNQIIEMSKNANEQALSTAESSAKIASLESQFSNLVKSTQQTNNDAEKVLKNTNSLVTNVSKTTGDNKNYSYRFSKVLKNTHNGGADNPHVFEFLVNPLSKKGKYINNLESMSTTPYLMTILTILVSSVLLVAYDTTLNKKTSRNNILYLLLLSAISSIVMSLLTFNISESQYKLAWTIYTSLAGLFIVVIEYVIWKLIPRIAPYILGIIIGSYLMLTPVLGISIQKDSFLSIFSDYSPLQIVENGFSEIILNRINITIPIILILTVFLLIAIYYLVLNQRRKKEQIIA